MIEVVCRTNLDLRNEQWPSELPAVPRVGDRITSGTVHTHRRDQTTGLMVPSKFQLELQVVGVDWEPIHDPARSHMSNSYKWIPYIELHMTLWQEQLRSKKPDAAPGSIMAFYEWYAPLVGTYVGAFI